MEVSRQPLPPHVAPTNHPVHHDLLSGLNQTQRENFLAHCQTLENNRQNNGFNRRQGHHQQRHGAGNRNFRQNPHPPAGVPRNPALYKTTMCDFWIAGQPCRFAERCWYAHGPQELRHPQDHSGHRRHNMRGNNFNRGSGEVIVDPALAAWNSAGGYQGSQIWEPPASTPSSPNLKLSPTEERFDSTFPVTTKEAIPHFPFGELCKLGSIGCERRSRGSSGSIDSIESRPDRQKMRTEVECFRTMVKEAEELMRNPEQVSDMEEFWSAFTTTTSKDHQSAAPVFPKVNLPPGTENVFDDTEIWNSFALQSFLF